MTQYKDESVNVTNGSPIVTGNGTLWLGNINEFDLFKLQNMGSDYVVYSVDDNGQITLTSYWAGKTLTYRPYSIHRNFTDNYRFPEINVGDRDWAYYVTKAFRLIDQALRNAGIIVPDVVDHGTDTEITLTSSDFNKIHIFRNTASANVYLPSIDSSDLAKWIEFRKKGVGDLTIIAADSDTIVDNGTELYNTNDDPYYDFINLYVEISTHWSPRNLFGSWPTNG